MYLELGIMRISTIIKARRINFLHYLATRSQTDMLYKVFHLQWNNPCKDDWTEQVKQDLKDFKLEANLENIKAKSSSAFKRSIKIKAMEYELASLMKVKKRHSKMDNLNYSKLDM